MPKPNDNIPRETEDDKARRELGGVKGSRRLAPAPLAPREREQGDQGQPATLVTAKARQGRAGPRKAEPNKGG